MNQLINDDFNQIAAALAHEVKNPVALIKANIELLEKSAETQGFNNNIEIIKKQLNKITYLISDFTQLVKTNNPSNLEEIFICDLINDIIEDYDISLKGKNISFDMKTDNEDISIFGNYTKLSILFFNIFKNAVEAISDKGKISTEITKTNNTLVISVKDNGEGVSKEILDNLFKPFITTKREGSGLGLSICKNIAEEFNGDFVLKNRQEGGCEAVVTLRC